MKDVYEMVLIAPIIRSKTMGQVRSRARSSRVKFARTEKATRMNVGDASRVYDRILAAEAAMAARIVSDEFVYGRAKA